MAQDDPKKTIPDGPGAPDNAARARWLLIAIVLITVSAVIIYSRITSAPFIFDDEFIIVKNVWTHNFSTLQFADKRFIGFLTFAINYQLGGLDTFGYHIVNIAIHIINGVLVYMLVVSLFKSAALEGYSCRAQTDPAPTVALTAALLFTVHPVNIMAVTYIVQRFASLATLFYLLSLVLYLRWMRARSQKASSSRGVYVLALLCAAAAQKTKEISFTLPFMLVFIEFFVFPGTDGARKKAVRLAPFVCTLLIIPLSLFGPGLARSLSSGSVRPMERLVPGDLKVISPYDYLITQFRVIVTYLRLLVLPVNQNIDYEYPVYHSLASPAPALSLLFHVCVFLGALWLFIRARLRKNLFLLLISCGIFWFYITLSIESSVIPLRDVIYEHRVYLPGIGLFISFSAAFALWFTGMKEKTHTGVSLKTATIVLLCLTALPFSASAYRRNLVWSDKIRLYEDTARKSPDNARAQNNLGVEYGKAGRQEEAIREFKATLRLNPDFVETRKNLANSYHLNGQNDLAIAEYLRYLRLVPGDKDARQSLADIYRENGRYAEAKAQYEAILSRYPKFVDARNNLANIHLFEGDLDAAIREYEVVLAAEPGHVEATYNMAIALEKKGDLNRAAYYYRRFVELAPPEYGQYIKDVKKKLEGMGRR